MRAPASRLGVGFAAWTLALTSATGATMLPGGGSRRTDCIVELSATGTAFPAGQRALGATCADGDACDRDGERNGICQFSASVCINTRDASLPRCKPTDVTAIRLRGRRGTRPRSRVDMSALETALNGLGLPSSASQCTTPVAVDVPVSGPDRRGEFGRGVLDVHLRARTSRGVSDTDRFLLVCLPATGSAPVTPTTTTLPPPAAGTPGPGLEAQIVAASIGSAGDVQVTFTLTDDAGVAVEPTLSATTGPSQARVRFTIARLEIDLETREGFTTDFTRYVNYITATQTSPITQVSSDQPTYDAGGTFALVDAATGTWTYAFATMLPAGFPAALTHTVGAQIERTFEDVRSVANPVFDFVPAGGAVTTVREVTTTEQCNACHGRLEAHGGGRREVHLCQLCHTGQAIDPDTGNSIEFQAMIHKIHRGKDLPSLAAGPVGTKYSIIGFRQTEVLFGERVRFCDGGQNARTECTSDTDCPGGACVDSAGSTIKTVGVGFPQDIRNCEKCHAEGATAANHKERPSATACASCHDDVNPSETPLNGLAPGANHGPLAGGGFIGAKPDAFCRLCHTAEGEEFGLSVKGAHTIPEESSQLAGLGAEILSASGSPGAPVTVTFRIHDGAGTPLPTLSGKVCSRGSNVSAACTADTDCPGGTCIAMDRVAFALSGPTSDLGGGEVRTCGGGAQNGAACTTDADCPGGACTGVKAMIAPTAVGGGSSGTLTGPDASGVYTYTASAANALPASARGTWRIGLEARRVVTVDTPDPASPETVEEAVQNPVLDFSVDGTPVVPRREVVAIESCGQCHGTFSRNFSVHGNLRNQTEYCVVCHNPNVSDFARRSRTFCAVTCGTNKIADTTAAGDDVQLIAPAGSCASSDTCVVAVGPDGTADTAAAGDDGQRTAVGTGAASAVTESINLKRLIHHLHTGEELENKPYIVYGFGVPPLSFTPNDFGDIRFPRDRRDCAACHVNDSQLLPLPDGLLPTRDTAVMLNPDPSKWPTAPFVESIPGLVPPIQSACLACHDGTDAKAHAETQTTASGAEACGVCHEEGKIEAVSEVHTLP